MGKVLPLHPKRWPVKWRTAQGWDSGIYWEPCTAQPRICSHTLKRFDFAHIVRKGHRRIRIAAGDIVPLY